MSEEQLDKKSSRNKSEDEDILQEGLEDFEQCEEASNDNRKEGLEDLEFSRLSKQWPEKILKQREMEGRPALVINKLSSFIKQVINDARQNKPQIKVHPVDDNADVKTAKILSGLIRNIEAISRADIAYDTAIDFAASMGFGYIRITTDYACDDTFTQDILIKRVANPFTVYEDPNAESADGSDWNIAFTTELMTKKHYKQAYPNAKIIDWKTSANDKKMVGWFDKDSVRVAERWKRTKIKEELYKLSNGIIIKRKDFEKNIDLQQFVGAGQLQIVDSRIIESYQVKQYIMSGAEILEENDWAGRWIPIVPVYGEELNVEGKRIFKSLIRDAKDTQRNFNYWRSAATELVALAPKAPWIGPKGFAKADENWGTANTKNHAYLEYDGNIAPVRQPFAGMPAGALQEALSASDDMKAVIGMYDASLGARSNETSGRAIRERRIEGDISTFHFSDNLSRSIRQTGAIVMDLIPHIYNKERIVRVLGEDGTPQTIPVNQPIMVNDKDEIVKEGGIARIYDLTTGKYDVAVSSGPSFTTRREEAAYQMTELLRSFPQAAPVIGDLYAKNLDWPGADEIAERLKAINPVLNKQNQAPSPEQMKMQADMQMKQQELQFKEKESAMKLKEKEMDLLMKNKDLQIKNLELQAQREKNQTEILKSKIVFASNQINQQNDSRDNQIS